ncbi:hypothetical protein ACFSHR_00285 [Azotobacter chroococcum]
MATLEHAEREKQVQAQQERQAEGEARLLVRELRGMAALLSCRGHGWTEGGKKLQALHDPAVKEVRTLVEGLAALPQKRSAITWPRNWWDGWQKTRPTAYGCPSRWPR